MRPLKNIADTLKVEGRFLLFSRASAEMVRLERPLLLLGIVTAGLAGIGRYWDNPRAALWQQMGLGSVVMVFALALLLWLIMWPLRPNNWHYKGVLTFVGMTAPLGFIYALPVERWAALEVAQTINVWFLAVVTLWRVALLVLYLKRSGGLGVVTAIVATFLPLVLIVAALTVLNLEHVVFNIMGGLPEDQRTGNDVVYEVLVGITLLSVLAAPVLLIVYGALVWMRRRGESARSPGS